MPDLIVGNMDRKHRAGLWPALLMAGLAAGVVSCVVPQFQGVLAAFGPDLPWFSRSVLDAYLATWLLPLSVLALWHVLRDTRQRSTIVMAAGAVSLFVGVPVVLVALYLPIFKLAAVM